VTLKNSIQFMLLFEQLKYITSSVFFQKVTKQKKKFSSIPSLGRRMLILVQIKSKRHITATIRGAGLQSSKTKRMLSKRKSRGGGRQELP
jgi:hypothetical protein